jgi:ferredoxin-NADP reductase
MSVGVASGTGRLTWQKATVAEVLRRTPRIKSFFLSLAQPMRFVAGQHVDIRLVAPDGYEARRSYSIANAPERPELLELAVERLDEGEVSTFFHDEVRAGDEVELRGPIGGHFIWSVADESPVLLIGGGSGVVPLVSMIRHHALAQGCQRLVLVASARTLVDLPYREELEARHVQAAGFSWIATVTREPATAAGVRSGRIDRAMLATALQALGAPLRLGYVCGNNRFVETVTAILLELQVPAARIRTERYGG